MMCTCIIQLPFLKPFLSRTGFSPRFPSHRTMKSLFSLHHSTSQSNLPFPNQWIPVVGFIPSFTRTHTHLYITGRPAFVPLDRRKLKLYFPRPYGSIVNRYSNMRKTKLIILPTKCLNQLGFLLLFLSCPVIGDWGRIRPDSEMSQWSILIEREGSCGLVRDSPGIKNAFTPDGFMECEVADGKHRNTTLLTENLNSGLKSETDVTSFPAIPVQESQIRGRDVRISRIQAFAERRLSTARREPLERSLRRTVSARQIRNDRRSISLDRQNTLRREESFRRNDREQQSRRQERESRTEIRERNDYRRSPDRRMDSRRMSLERRVRDNNQRMLEATRRISLTRREREAGDRRERVETALRRTENTRRQSRSEEREVEERRTARREARRNSEARESTRRTTGEIRQIRDNTERRGVDQERASTRLSVTRRENTMRRTSQERRMEIRDYREERRSVSAEKRITDRRSSEEREVLQNRRRENSPERRVSQATIERRTTERADDRRVSPERRTRAFNSPVRQVRNDERRIQNDHRERMEREIRREASDRRVRDTAEANREDRRRETSERNARSTMRSERLDERRVENIRRVLLESQARRIDTPRKQEMRLSVRRVDKPQDGAERRVVEEVLSRLRDHREKTERNDRRVTYDGLQTLAMKQTKTEKTPWELVNSIKYLFSGKGEQGNWMAEHGSFTTTCLVGAAAYLLTTRQAKSV